MPPVPDVGELPLPLGAPRLLLRGHRGPGLDREAAEPMLRATGS